MLKRASSQRLTGRGDQLAHPLEGNLLARVLDPEAADRRASQLRAVGIVQRLDQSADVGAGRAFDLVARLLAVAVEQLCPVDVHLSLGRLDDLAAVGLLV